jgi:hypothetical protein
MSTRSRGGAPSLLRAAALLSVLASSAGVAEAIPAFARRYSLPCDFCHEGYPQLSVLGEQFKERGYRLESDTSGVSEWWDSIPVSFRGALRQAFEEDGDADTSGRFHFVSAGSLSSRFSYWLDETYYVDSDGFDRLETDNAFLRVEVLPDELYLRGGRMELDLPFTQARTPQLFAYEVYFANTGFETDDIGGHHDGLEAGGFLDEATRWSVAVVNGRNSEGQTDLSDAAGGFDPNLFGRLMHRFGEDRAGGYLYWGRNTLARENPEPVPGAPPVLEWDDSLFRIGIDGSVHASVAHIFGTLLYGRNSNSYADAQNPGGTHEALSFTGAFAQADVAIRDTLVLSGRLDWIHGPPPQTAGPNETFVAFSPGLKLWLHPRLRLAFELNFRNGDRPTRGAIQLDLAL